MRTLSSRAVAGSIEAVGSSRSSSRGRLSTALARETRVCSPDDSSPAFTSAKRSRSKSWSTSSMRAFNPLTL